MKILKGSLATIGVFLSCAPAQADREEALIPVWSSALDAGKKTPGAQIFSSGVEAITPTIGEWLKHSASGITASDPDGNPFWHQIFYRGYLLGQGLAAYQNGDRVNELFGDRVNINIFPDMAVHKLKISSAGDALFGQNALGGAVVVSMKNGFNYKTGGGEGRYTDAEIELHGGSFGRTHVLAQKGWELGRLGIYNSISFSREDGWRDHSPSYMLRNYQDLAWRLDRGELGLGLTLMSANSFAANGTTPEELLQQSRRSILAWPDKIKQNVLFLQGRSKFFVSEQIELDGRFHYRNLYKNRLDSEISTIEHSVINSNSGGVSMQMTARPSGGWIREIRGGGIYNQGKSNFTLSSEPGLINRQHRVESTGTKTLNTDMQVSSAVWNLYASMLLPLYSGLELELSGRYDDIDVSLKDRIGTALDGSGHYRRFNPVAKLKWKMPGMQWFARYAESNRSPTPLELSCADKDNPCSHPDDFVAQGTLKQVVSRRGEIGVEGRRMLAGGQIEWLLSGYYGVNSDDIVFIGNGTGTGYFTNVGQTLRAGLESRAGWSNRMFDVSASYNYTDASFQKRFNTVSTNHPEANAAGEITVLPGSKLPLIPAHSGFIRTKWNLLRAEALKAHVGMDLYMASNRFLHGDESNTSKNLPGFARLDMHMSIMLVDVNSNRRIRLFLRAENVSLSKYSTYGALEQSDSYEPRFVTPAAPVAVFAGIRLTR